MGLMEMAAAIPWDSEPVKMVMGQVVRSALGLSTDNPDTAREKRLTALLDRYDQTIRGLQAPAATYQTLPTTPRPAATTTGALAEVVSRVTLVAGNAKEALRFAREDGMSHPEVQLRLADAQAQLDELERHTLRPEALVTLPPAERAAVDALMPEIRRARQGLHNTPDGGPPTVDSLTDAAAKMGTVGTRARVLALAAESGMAPAAAPTPTPAAAAPTTGPYSAYAPDMSLDTGCLPCGRAHVAATDAILQAAAREAANKGMADPDVQGRIQSAAEELAMVYEHDWTPARVAKSPPADRAILETYTPQFTAAKAQLDAAKTPDDIARVARDLHDARMAFMAADQARANQAPPAPDPGTFASFVTAGHVRTVPGDHRLAVRPWTIVQPGAFTLGATTQPTDSAAMFDRLANAIHEGRGTRVVFRETPRADGGIVEAEYDPATNTITMGPFALAKDFYAVQTLAHEVAHALDVGRTCMPTPPQDHGPGEEVAEDAALAAMVETDSPIELRSGDVLPAGTRTVDWGMVQDELTPDLYGRVRFATDWIVGAMGGADPKTLPQGCAVALPVGEAI